MGGADFNHLVGKARRQHVAIGRGDRLDGRDPEFTRRSNYADGDLTAIGNQDLRYSWHSSLA